MLGVPLAPNGQFMKANALTRRAAVALFLGCALVAASGCAVRAVTLYDATERTTEQISTLRLPYAIDVIAIDGKKYKGVLPVAEFIDYEILPGNHEIAMRYFQPWMDEDGNNEFVKSPAIAVTQMFEPGAVYAVAAQKPKTVGQARKYASDLVVSVVQQGSGKEVKSVLLPASRQDGGLLANLVKKNGETTEASGLCSQNGPAGTPCTAFDQLGFWWNRATDDEKARFKLQIGAD